MRMMGLGLAAVAFSFLFAGPSGPPAASAQATRVDPDLRAAFPEAIRNAGVIRVGITAPQPPFNIVDPAKPDDFAGVDSDLAKALAARAGLRVEFRNMAFAGLIPALQAGQVDVLWSGLLPTPQRQEVADFVIYFRNPFGLLVRGGNPLRITGVKDLCGRNVGIVQGSTPPQMIVEERQPRCTERGQQPIRVTFYPDAVTTQLAIQAGAVDATVGAGAAMAYVAQTAGGGRAFDFVLDGDGLGGVVYFADGVAIPKNNQALLTAVQRGVQGMIDDGTYMEIMRRYNQQEFSVRRATINVLE
jgi:polar amino acid transport system substrate-binding protein